MSADFPARLSIRLAGPLPGTRAQIEMAPVYRRDADMARIDGKDCRDAAVLLLFFPGPDGPDLLFIERPNHLAFHAGQIAFPGGRREAGESLVETALRETEEEVGIPRGEVSVVGALTPLFIPPSAYCVHPFVGWLDARPAVRPAPEEVSNTFVVPLRILTDPSARSEFARRVKGVDTSVPCFVAGDHRIWGATAMMTAELVSLLAGPE